MDLSKPFTAASPSLDISVLVALAGSATPRSGREIARRTGHSKTGVQRVLDRLVEQGKVDRLEAGSALLYSLNRDHLLAPIVEQLAQIRVELVRRLRETVTHWEQPPVHASLFGSAARGEGDVHSDVDLLIVRPRQVDAESNQWRTQIDELAESIRRWTGNHADIIEISEDDLPHLRRNPPPVIAQIREDAIDLAGEPARMLFN
jgi:predicted nucleotidyltransferase